MRKIYDFWLRSMASGARDRYLPEPPALHRVRATQKSARLETVHRSDIQLISELKRDFSLGAKENRAIDEAIAERERMIAELNRPRTIVSDVVRPAPGESSSRLSRSAGHVASLGH